MSTLNQALITPRVVRWARERARRRLDKLAKTLHTKPEHVESWEEGTSAPTINQAQRLAEVLHIPFGYLFLPSPPEEKLPLPDFRTVVGAELGRPSGEFIDLLNDVIIKQQWYRHFLLEQGRVPLPFIGQFSVKDGYAKIAKSIRETLGISHALRTACSSPDEFLRTIIRNAGVAGILMMRSGVAQGNTRRPLSVEEFRGFAISDPIAPVIFVNGRDASTAQVFTVAHELTHLWIGATGISNEHLKRPLLADSNEVERFCNSAAAEVLIPESEFTEAWNPSRSTDDNMHALARDCKVSTVVVLRRAYELGQLNWAQYAEAYQKEEQKFKSRQEHKKKGGDFFKNVVARNSPALTRAAVYGAIEGRVLYRDAARLLNVGVPVIQSIAHHLSKRTVDV